VQSEHQRKSNLRLGLILAAVAGAVALIYVVKVWWVGP
jgi:hypothetical protein